MPIREAGEPRVFDYPGPETQVMVVPKDINKARGFISGLSDIADVWYKKTGWIYQDDDVVSNSIQQDDTAAAARKIAGKNAAAEIGKGTIIESTLDRLIDFEKVKNNPHLVGWHLDVRYVNVGTFKELDTYGMDGSASYILPYENRIRNPHFAKTTMMHDKRSVTKIAYVVHLGIENDPVHVEVVRQPITGTLIKDGETVVVRQIIQAVSITFTSKEEHTLSGDILGSNNKLEGNVKLYRIGPYPDEKDFGSAIVTDGSFNVPNLPYGAYKIDFENKCGCLTEMENSFVFKDEETNIFEVEEKTKNVTIGLTIVTRVDDADEPLKNKPVTIKSTDCVPEEKSADGTTDEAGLVTFDDMPIGKYDVYVEGKVVSSITFCDNYNGIVTVSSNHLWKFRIVYSNPDYGNGTITATDIDIDFEAEADQSGTKIYAAAESTCGGVLYGCGDFYIFNDTIVKPGSKWVSFDSMIIIDATSHLEGQMISAEMDYGMNGLVCDGHIPADFNADSDTTTWTYSNGFSSWTLTLEPCAPGGCD